MTQSKTKESATVLPLISFLLGNKKYRANKSTNTVLPEDKYKTNEKKTNTPIVMQRETKGSINVLPLISFLLQERYVASNFQGILNFPFFLVINTILFGLY